MMKCLQKLHGIVNSPEYHGQEIHLGNADADHPFNTFNYEKDDASGTEPFNVFVGNVTSKDSAKCHDFHLWSIYCFPSRLFAKVMIYEL